MKLSVSNIAWETVRMDEHLSLLNKLGCDGLELSPSMIWPEPVGIESAKLLEFKRKVSRYDLAIPSMHSLTYPRPDLTFLDSAESRENLIEYIVSLAEIANLMEIPVMVFGSAKSRKIGDRDRELSEKIIIETLQVIATRIDPLGVTMLIEPLTYEESDFINNLDEAHELIEKVAHPRISFHMDLRSSFTVKENQREAWSKYGGSIKHCHVGNPGFNPPSMECKEHQVAAEAMKKSNYKSYISVEMGRNYGETLDVVRDAVEFVRVTYLDAA